MARYELVDGSSSKFWEIRLDGAAFTVTFGRIGTAGQTQTKTFGSAAQAAKERDKLVAEKLKKGYALVGRGEAAGGAARAASRAKVAAPSRASKPARAGKPTAATLAAAWGREVPAALAALLAAEDLRALQKRKVTIRYAGEHVATLAFEHPAFGDLADWMEGVGLGDDIVWPKEKGVEFKKGLPIAVIECEDLERELLAVRTDKPALPVFIFTEGRFFPLWDSLAELLAELRGTRVNPSAALKKALAEAATLEKKARFGEAAAALEAALAAHGPAVRARDDHDGNDVLDSAHHRAGYCRYKAGDLDAAERHYAAAAELGGAAAAQNLVVMAAEDRKDWKLVLERVAAYWDTFGYASDEGREFTCRYRALAHVMRGDAKKAVAVLGEVEEAFFSLDSFEAVLGRVEELLVDARPPASKALEALRARSAALVAAWRAARAPKRHATPRAWWNDLDDVWRNIFKANLGKPGFYQIPFKADARKVTDAELAKILALRRLKIFTVEMPRDDDEDLGTYRVPTSLAPLARLEALEELDGEYARGPYSLAPLAGLARLRVLALEQVELESLAPLAGHPALEVLHLRGTNVDDLAPLGALPRLTKLELWGTSVSDLAPLDRCPALTEVLAGSTEVRALPLLPSLTKLKVVDVRFCGVRRPSIAAFQKAHPGCEVRAKG